MSSMAEHIGHLGVAAPQAEGAGCPSAQGQGSHTAAKPDCSEWNKLPFAGKALTEEVVCPEEKKKVMLLACSNDYFKYRLEIFPGGDFLREM